MSHFEGTQARVIPEELVVTARWYALRTRGRTEKQADRLLRERGVESYAAVAEVEREWSDRLQRVGMPLFPGYIFARFRLADLVPTLSVPGVVDVIRSEGVPAPIREEELTAVRRLAEGVTATGVLPSEADFLEPGEPVTVTSGPFEGMEGVLLEARGASRVVVRIPAIRQARAVRLERSVLKRSRPRAS